MNIEALNIIYNSLSEKPVIGNNKGICRITGLESVGMPFNKWVKKTFSDHYYLFSGDIISNQAAFCFCELSKIMQEKTGRDKPQNFRTYSHLIDNKGNWFCYTKSDKKLIVDKLQNNPNTVCLTDSGQKHIFFKNRVGFWQLDEMFVQPDIDTFNDLHSYMMNCLLIGVNQTELKTGLYKNKTISKIGIEKYLEIEKKLKPKRGSKIFDFSHWLLYTIKK